MVNFGVKTWQYFLFVWHTAATHGWRTFSQHLKTAHSKWQQSQSCTYPGPRQITCQVWNAEISEDREFLNTQECTITLLTQHLEGFQFYFCRFSGCRFCVHGVWWFQLFSEKGCLLLLVDIKLIDEWKLEWTNRIELRDLKLEQWAIKKVKKNLQEAQRSKRKKEKR